MPRKNLTPEARDALLEVRREVRELVALLQKNLRSRPEQ